MKAFLFTFVSASLIACSGHAAADFSSKDSTSNSASNSDVVNAAIAEINLANQNHSTDTQCSDFVASVMRRIGLQVHGFRANDFHEVAAKALPTWKMTEFQADDLSAARDSLRRYLNSFPDHTAFFAQWPRTGQSGHVAVVEKVSDNTYMIYQAQGGLNTPYSKSVKIEGLMYGTLGIERSHIRLWTEE